MIKREEEIREAAEIYSAYVDATDEEDLYNSTELEAFEDGAKWADNHPINVWHDASDEPQIGSNIVFVDKYGHWWDIQPYNDGNYDWDGLKGWACCVHINHIQKWTYIQHVTERR